MGQQLATVIAHPVTGCWPRNEGRAGMTVRWNAAGNS
jgi:hypothetical protein